ncbi:lysophospholipid acyltransferase family protein [Halioxenophilus aromaticivorans]|uniref:Lysophospholipid acyltransferase n=1 Tax=Halioxenophilus aromaticivorans TaxID=1306992 RepID=A0AAV3U8Y3_9ALTE
MADQRNSNIGQNPKPSTQAKRRVRAQGADIKGTLLVAVLRAMSILPLAVLRFKGLCLGWLLWRFNAQAAKVSRENLTYAYPVLPDSQRERLVLTSLQESGKTGFEMAAVWARGEGWLQNHIVAEENPELLHSNDMGKGVMVLSPHVGNWEVLSGYLGQACRDITVMYQPAQLPALDDLIRTARLRNIKVAPADRSGVMMLMKALRGGEAVGLLPDQVPTEGAGEYADFYGKPALTMTLIRQLHKKTQANIVMVFALRVPGGFKIVCQKPHPDIYSEQPDIALLGLNKSVQQCIDPQPSQYQWQYKRYRRQPEGEPRPYRFK